MKHYFYYDISKRVFDIVFSIIALTVLFPFFIIIGVLIKIDSPGTVFYKSLRTGRYGKPFRVYKFRSMVQDAEKRGSTATARNDARVTSIGKIIRRYKIDEMPQLINVIKGEMSMVGPRPEVEEHTKCYNEIEKSILDVLPGISDYSSIHFINLNEMLGNENANQVFIEKYRDEKNRLRLEYVKSRSFCVDVKIICDTVIKIFIKRKWNTTS